MKLAEASTLTADRKVREKRIEYRELIDKLPKGEAGVIEIPESKDYMRERTRLLTAAQDLGLEIAMRKAGTQLLFWVPSRNEQKEAASESESAPATE
jgi:hypothetical protein